MNVKIVTSDTLSREIRALEKRGSYIARFGIEYARYNAQNFDNEADRRHQHAKSWRHRILDIMDRLGVDRLSYSVERERHGVGRHARAVAYVVYLDDNGTRLARRRRHYSSNAIDNFEILIDVG